MKPIYLDYAATTPVDTRVVVEMQACLMQEGAFGNPASLHVYGQAARALIEAARERVAATIGADTSEVVFTSGATESINLALKGVASLYPHKGQHIVTMKTEHKAVLDVCQQLEKDGFRITYLAPLKNGLLDMAEFKDALREDTLLVSIMHVNNESGVIQDIDAIAQCTAEKGILLHVDAAQTIGKLAINLNKTPIDLMSLCAHKVYGPKGVGALYLRKKPRVRVAPLMHGGGHEQGMRSGTMATHQIVGMGKAFELAVRELSDDVERISTLRDYFLMQLQSIQNLKMNTTLADCVPSILNVRFSGMFAEALLTQLPGIATSSASACQGKGTEGSYVLRAMGYTEEEAKSSIRFSLGRFSTMEEITAAARTIVRLFEKAP